MSLIRNGIILFCSCLLFAACATAQPAPAPTDICTQYKSLLTQQAAIHAEVNGINDPAARNALEPAMAYVDGQVIDAETVLLKAGVTCN